MNEVELYKYLNDMRLKETWGDGIMLSAAAWLYERPVELFLHTDDKKLTCKSFPLLILLRPGLINSNHYIRIRSQTPTHEMTRMYILCARIHTTENRKTIL